MRQLARFVLSLWVLGLMTFGAYSILNLFTPMPVFTGVILTIAFILPSVWLALAMMLLGVRSLLDAVWPVQSEHEHEHEHEREPTPMPPDIAG